MKFDSTNLGALAAAVVIAAVAIIARADAAHMALAGSVITGCFAVMQSRRGDPQ